MGEGLGYFPTPVEHLAKAVDDADIEAGNLLDAGNQQLQKAIDQYAEGDTDGAEKHEPEIREKALRTPCVAYFRKTEPAEVLLGAIRKAILRDSDPGTLPTTN